MAQDKFKRKLTTIFRADVAGYSRLMGEDEAATVKTLEQYKGIMSELIRQHRGRVVDSPGDNLLAEFTSVVDAVQCAVATQKELHARNTELPENRKMRFRIGVNLGDVIEEESRIYGDGVNIAARLESLAEPGGICISKTAFDQIETKLPFGYSYLGEQTVKNISKPVGAYRVLMEPRVTKERGAGFKAQSTRRRVAFIGLASVLVIVAGGALWQFFQRSAPVHQASPSTEKADPQKMAYALPDKPSIAVLPFVNMSEDKSQEYFSDGLTEEIITALSKTPKLFVIARNSTFTYKGMPLNVQQVSRELGVRYILEGSVRRTGDQLRITAQLVETTTGNHLWAERYDRRMKDIFAIQDEITMKIVNALEVKLTKGEQARLTEIGTTNLEAYLKVLQGTEHAWRANRADNNTALELFKEAIAIDPDYAIAYARLAWAYWIEVWLGFGKSPEESIRQGLESAQKAISLNDSLPLAHNALAGFHLLKREHRKAISEGQKTIILNPNWAEGYMWLGQNLVFAGKPEEAISNLEIAIRLDPFARSAYFHILGMAYREAGRYEEAIAACQEAIRRQSNNVFAHLILASTYIMVGREPEARVEAAEILRINPKFSLERFAKVRPHIDPENTARFVDALRKVGLPE
jgi:adenylate cyclase